MYRELLPKFVLTIWLKVGNWHSKSGRVFRYFCYGFNFYVRIRKSVNFVWDLRLLRVDLRCDAMCVGNRYQRFRGSVIFTPLEWRRRQNVLPKCWFLISGPHGLSSYNSVILSWHLSGINFARNVTRRWNQHVSVKRRVLLNRIVRKTTSVYFNMTCFTCVKSS
jgi:hypothetical protein